MSASVTGGCLCGACRYEYDGEVGPANYCHCADCRRVTGSAFNVSVRLQRAHFKIEGPVKYFAKQGDSGTIVARYFCGDCGSPLYTASPKHPDLYFVKAGSLDDPSIVKPTFQAWTVSRVAWSRIDPACEAFERGRK